MAVIVTDVEETSAHLRDRIEARRIELGYTPTTLSDATGLSGSALKNIRKGKVRAYQERLTIPLTDALGWTRDSIDRLMAGLEPIAVASDQPPAAEARIKKLEDEVAALRQAVRELQQGAKKDAVERLSATPAAPAIDEARRSSP